MKHLHNILEDKDYILSEEQKFLDRGCNISVEKRNEMEEYYDAYKHELGMMEDGEWEFLELSQEMIDKRKNMIQEIQDTNLDFALRRMTDVISFGESKLSDYVYYFKRVAKDDRDSYFRMVDFVHHINAFYDITGEKAPNRIAWGWNQFHSKDVPMAYLYGCIRNYLRRNNKFDQKQFNRIWGRW